MKVDGEKLRKIARKKNLSINDLLKKARVSKTAFYHLLRKDTLLPVSLRSIGEALSVPADQLLTKESPRAEKMRKILAETDRIVSSCPGLDPDTVRLTLLLLEEKPIERLRRSLTRGRALDFHS